MHVNFPFPYVVPYLRFDTGGVWPIVGEWVEGTYRTAEENAIANAERLAAAGHRLVLVYTNGMQQRFEPTKQTV